jgi:transcriptional regulator with XRE-family HTH domain
VQKSPHTEAYRLLLSILTAKRKNAGLTQETLAAKLGKPQSFVSKFENGERRLDLIEFIHVARSIGADPAEIVRTIEKNLKPKS